MPVMSWNIYSRTIDDLVKSSREAKQQSVASCASQPWLPIATHYKCLRTPVFVCLFLSLTCRYKIKKVKVADAPVLLGQSRLSLTCSEYQWKPVGIQSHVSKTSTKHSIVRHEGTVFHRMFISLLLRNNSIVYSETNKKKHIWQTSLTHLSGIICSWWFWSS